ncbi:MAG: hypothetical protein CMN93_08510 [Synechococcus sp. CPC35]|nr:hypothetical protein [Synechococcus sp. CPC35]
MLRLSAQLTGRLLTLMIQAPGNQSIHTYMQEMDIKQIPLQKPEQATIIQSLMAYKLRIPLMGNSNHYPRHH